MEKLKMHSPNLVQQNIARIGELFPGCVTEAGDGAGRLRLSVDFDRLRQELSETLVEGPRERYHLDWPGKREALLAANAPIAKTLRPCREESVDFDSAKNLFIEGDSLDALKLLQEACLGKVNLIYIDPPYNTGNDFIYEDDYAEDAQAFLVRSGQKDRNLNRLVANTEANGRFHSDWLSMIYPRLRLARNLLRDDGAIFISIDDNELFSLKQLCDEVFGEDNFAATFIVKSNPRGSQSDSFSASVHENILCYVRNRSVHPGFVLPLPEDMVSEYRYSDAGGKYRLLGLRLRGGSWRRDQRPLLYYPIYVDPDTGRVSVVKGGDFTIEVLPVQPSTKDDGTWRWSREKLHARLDAVIGKKVSRDGNIAWDVFQKDYLESVEGERKGTKPKTIWDEKEVNYQNGTNEIKELFNRNVFDFPKPTHLLKKILLMAGGKDALVLDFFAGSCSTAQAVMQLNAQDGGERRFIMVQVPEPCNEKSEACRAGYATIAEVGKERIRRAGRKILEGECHEERRKDAGFRVLKIDASNMAEVWYAPEALDREQLCRCGDNIKPDRTPEDLLFQVMLDRGMDLSLPIRRETIRGRSVFFVDEKALAACFDSGLDEDFVRELAAFAPHRAVFLDSGFASDAVKINVEQIFRQISPSTEVKSI